MRQGAIVAVCFWAMSTFGQDETSLVAKYKKEISVNLSSSITHFRLAEICFHQREYQSAANEFREALNGDLQPSWVEVWAHVSLGKIFDITGQRERAINEYRLVQRTKDNTRGALDEAELYLAIPYPRESQR
jgi:tetratricopeptide (TPR) repeat protein